ncbi:type ISP restriction/modification enzyme [Rhizobium leguminosarum]|uniref:type ISP restriction/modification enzyme n=1 Tax=Rhizobium leguminosarum TaxID=384 RepID=UPI00102FABC3|nr:type ISP restriction/modification enzyme [Rhizobium leguminosarum]TBG01342.1 DNA methyltransferase [Rhizobium leguminosarum]TBG60890.1 DNA methyltransferase [Rhizobium leguminosarum]
MSQQLINQYLSEIDRLRKFSGLANEQIIRPAFRRLLDSWSSSNKLVFLEEYPVQTSLKTTVYPDGAVLHDIRVPLGYWEAKDTKDDLDEEIRKKFSRGYPQDNIIFENSETAVLIQNRQEITRASMTDTAGLLRLVTLFFNFERPEIAEFRRAVEKFRADLPTVLDALRKRIDVAYSENASFQTEAARFLVTCKETINPTLGEADVREMLIQHILTEEIFTHVFNDGDFHHENNIAKELYALEGKFFTGTVKRETLKGLEPYYAAIRANAAQITNHSEKQTFLKVIYENFYKVYDKKKADRLGVVYTPNEIVKFMIEGADWLCEKHFDKNLIDEHVEILDPATGTGTFICELLEYFRGDARRIAHKYKNELHANEVAILPYYVANLNIEATYAAITGQFAEYLNLCFVDTLDNINALGIKTGQHVGDLFGAMSDENVERIKRQNARKISVIIGNPPYNANQQNENENNKNRSYEHIDRLIKDSYIRLSTAQKTKVYDMYARFFRWASDRMHDDGVLAFVTNRSFIESRTFDGFRKAVAEEFNEIYVVDLGGDVRVNPKLSGTKHNVFGIQTGVAIAFMVKRRKQKGCKIFYTRRDEFDTAADKLTFLGSSKLSGISFDRIEPDKKGNWVNLAENQWDDLVPLADKKTKSAKAGQERAIFKLTSQSMKTNRDDWVYDFSARNLEKKVRYFLDQFSEARSKVLNHKVATDDDLGTEIKWTRKIKRLVRGAAAITFTKKSVTEVEFRPFVRVFGYRNSHLNEDQYQTAQIFDQSSEAAYIAINRNGVPHSVLAGRKVPDYHYTGDSELLPLYRYTSSGQKIENITDWGLKQFEKHYGKSKKITKEDIFYYVYAVMHDPNYREKYALNLKREFPRIPLHPEFRRWVDWGARLMKMHVEYKTVEPWPLARLDAPDETARAAGISPKAILRADKDAGIIRIDSETQLSGIPSQVWDYRLGNRSGLEWILDQHKEKTPKDPTIRDKFNAYRFADYKEEVIDLICRVTRVSVETMEIVDAMKSARPAAASNIEPKNEAEAV